MPRAAHGLEQHRGAGDVDVRVEGQVAEVHAEPDHGGLVAHRVHPGQRLVHRGRVAHVDRRSSSQASSRAGRCARRAERIQAADLVARLLQRRAMCEPMKPAAPVTSTRMASSQARARPCPRRRGLIGARPSHIGKEPRGRRRRHSFVRPGQAFFRPKNAAAEVLSVAMEIDVILPCLNEAGALPWVCPACRTASGPSSRTTARPTARPPSPPLTGRASCTSRNGASAPPATPGCSRPVATSSA